MATSSIIILAITFIVLPLDIFVMYRNERVFEFRGSLIKAIFKSRDWRKLEEEFNAVGYCSMIFSFKSLRVERWFSADFCKKINQIEVEERE